jgi:hypothetical protein
MQPVCIRPGRLGRDEDGRYIPTDVFGPSGDQLFESVN